MTLRQILLITITAMAILFTTDCGAEGAPDDYVVNPDQHNNAIKARIDAGALVLDVRTPGEYQSGHYPNAKLIPIDELQQRLPEIETYKNKTVITYCASGYRSRFAKEILSKAGFKDVINGGGLHQMPR
ncbi:MAG: rhodanese-like domain-containing protein [Leptospiraceae bacterium]|nr:rhodanese-like domain-containing protein [Leptospiraceae bacterium]